MWHALAEELRHWRGRNARPGFWWRDDDTGPADPPFRAFLAAIDRIGVPVGLAVVPGRLKPETAEEVRQRRHCFVMQHGYRHLDHFRSCEYPGFRHPREVSAEIDAGQAALQGQLAAQMIPVFVPPWNRLAPRFHPELARAGFRGISARLHCGPWLAQESQGLVEIPVHVNSTRPGAVFIGDEPFVAQVLRHLRAKRRGLAPWSQPTGILTHYFCEVRVWQAMDRLVKTVLDGGGEWLGGRDLVRSAIAPPSAATVRRCEPNRDAVGLPASG
jgi:hypothetical protein